MYIVGIGIYQSSTRLPHTFLSSLQRMSGVYAHAVGVEDDHWAAGEVVVVAGHVEDAKRSKAKSDNDLP